MDFEYNNPLFADWARRKFTNYLSCYVKKFGETQDPIMPPRKGITVGPTEGYPISLVKYEAAVWSVPYGSQFKGLTHTDILASMYLPPPSLKLFSTWRADGRFKKLVEQLKGEFAEYVATNIFFGSDEPLPLPYADSIIDYTGLLRKFQFIRQALNNYSPDLLGRITEAMAKFFASGEDSRTIQHYLGHHMWCIGLLYMFKNTTRKSPKKPVYLNICKKIIGRHWSENTLRDYLGRNTSQIGIDSPEKRWRDRFKNRSSWQKSLDERLTAPLLIAYFEELKGVVIAERRILERESGQKEESALTLEDHEFLVHYLVGTGTYGMYRPDIT